MQEHSRSLGVIPTVLAADSFVILADLRAVIPYCRRRFGDGISGEVADGLFGGGASPSCPELKGCAPEQPAVVDRGGSGRHEPGRCGPDRRDGSPDAARLGASVQHGRPRWSCGPMGAGTKIG